MGGGYKKNKGVEHYGCNNNYNADNRKWGVSAVYNMLDKDYKRNEMPTSARYA